MDDVGQTLLNWASAFGTLEMVKWINIRIVHNIHLFLSFIEFISMAGLYEAIGSNPGLNTKPRISPNLNSFPGKL